MQISTNFMKPKLCNLCKPQTFFKSIPNPTQIQILRMMEKSKQKKIMFLERARLGIDPLIGTSKYNT